MKVILLKDVRGVGRHGEVKEVADGYAINALFPKKFAEPATPEKVKQIEAQKQAHAAEIEKTEQQLLQKIDSLRGKKVTLSSRATEKGGLFKSVVAKDVARAIREQHSLEIPEAAIEIAQPIKTVGEHTVRLTHKAKSGDLVVAVAAA